MFPVDRIHRMKQLGCPDAGPFTCGSGARFGVPRRRAHDVDWRLTMSISFATAQPRHHAAGVAGVLVCGEPPPTCISRTEKGTATVQPSLQSCVAHGGVSASLDDFRPYNENESTLRCTGRSVIAFGSAIMEMPALIRMNAVLPHAASPRARHHAVDASAHEGGMR